MEQQPRTPDTPKMGLAELMDGLEQLLAVKGGENIAAIQEHVRGLESFTTVTSPVAHHELNAIRTNGRAREALGNPRLAELGIRTSVSAPMDEQTEL